MKSLFKIVLLVGVMLTIVGCPSDDSGSTIAVRDRQEVYGENIDDIKNYLKSNYIEIDVNNNVTVTKIPEDGTQTSIWDQYKTPDFGTVEEPEEVPYITVKNDTRTSLLTDGRIADDVDYKLYYIVLDEGNGKTPTSVDSTFVAYKGWNLENEIFDRNSTGAWFSYPDLNTSISGFRQILSKIKAPSASSLPTVDPDGTISYLNYGNVIVFIPSGLAYFNSATANIDAYAPIAFQIKLFAINERDHDFDEVPSKHEDFSYTITGERILSPDNDYFNDDTDGDKIPDFIDNDDDGDGFLTKFEVRHSITTGAPPVKTYYYYPFTGAASDDPLTPYDDTRGIPREFTGSLMPVIIPPSTTPVMLKGPGTDDFNNVSRLRRHLDPNAKPPFYDQYQ